MTPDAGAIGLYSYLTNNEIDILKKVLVIINTKAIYKTNFTTMSVSHNQLILDYITIWLSQPDFFLDVTNNINQVLKNINVFFDGNNIIFNNDLNPPYITIDGEQEIAYSCLTYEYDYDSFNNSIYRRSFIYDKIVDQYNRWINKIYRYNLIF